MNANEFVAFLSSLAPAFRQTSVRFQPSLGGERGGGSVYVNFVNLPPDVGSSGGGAEAENNRASFWVRGFAHDPTVPAATVKVEQAASVFHRPWLGAPGVPFRAKSGSPEVVARYLAAYLARVVDAVPPRFTHSAQEARRRAPHVPGAGSGLEWHRQRDSFVGLVDGAGRFLIDPSADGDWILWSVDPKTGLQTKKIGRYPTAADAKDAARTRDSLKEETPMPRKTPKSRREPSPKQEGEQIIEAADKAGADYANEQVGGDHFRDWVSEQVAEAERMRASDPDSVFPSDTPDGAKRAARNMLQQLEWDTKRQMDQREILELSGATGVFGLGSEDWVRDTYGITVKDVTDAFFAAFDAELEKPAVRQWLTDLILEINEDVRGVRKSELVRDGDSPEKSVLWRDIKPGSSVERVGRSYFVTLPDGSRASVYWSDRDALVASYALDSMAKASRRGQKLPLPRPRAAEPRSARSVVRDYVPVDSRGRPLSPPTKDYEKAKRQADKAGGVVKFKVGRQSAAHEAHRVRDYVPVDTRGRPLSPPTKDYGEAKKKADRAGGVVKFSAARGARERLRPRIPSRGRGGR
jgi:hypothetical protein